MSNDGWIKVYRKLLRNKVIWDTNEPYDARSAWIEILLSCQYADTAIRTNFGDIINLKKGQTYTSIHFLGSHWKWSRKRVDKFLKGLQNLGMITYSTMAHGTIITVVNWDDYQAQGSAGVATTVTSDDPSGVTSGVTSGDTLTRNKEYKECKEGKKKDYARARESSLSSRYNVNTEGLKRVIEE